LGDNEKMVRTNRFMAILLVAFVDIVAVFLDIFLPHTLLMQAKREQEA
jgi:hypothetical protein